MSLKHHCEVCDATIQDSTLDAYVIRLGVVAWAGSEVTLCSRNCVAQWTNKVRVKSEKGHPNFMCINGLPEDHDTSKCCGGWNE